MALKVTHFSELDELFMAETATPEPSPEQFVDIDSISLDEAYNEAIADIITTVTPPLFGVLDHISPLVAAYGDPCALLELKEQQQGGIIALCVDSIVA